MKSGETDQWKAAVFVIAISSGLTLAFVAILGWALRDLPDEIKLPLLVVAAVAGLLSSLALVVAVFAIYRLANKSYALGLPDGSVRAIIALLLIVLFSVTTVFLTVRLQNAAAGAPVVDFAKQLLTILGTLMTSVASFYFGTRAVTDGAKVSRSGPTDTEPPIASPAKPPLTDSGPSEPAYRPDAERRREASQYESAIIAPSNEFYREAEEDQNERSAESG